MKPQIYKAFLFTVWDLLYQGRQDPEQKKDTEFGEKIFRILCLFIWESAPSEMANESDSQEKDSADGADTRRR